MHLESLYPLQPLYGLIQAKLELITHAYFDEKDFSQTSLLHDTYTNMNASLAQSLLQHGSQVFLGKWKWTSLSNSLGTLLIVYIHFTRVQWGLLSSHVINNYANYGRSQQNLKVSCFPVIVRRIALAEYIPWDSWGRHLGAEKNEDCISWITNVITCSSYILRIAWKWFCCSACRSPLLVLVGSSQLM